MSRPIVLAAVLLTAGTRLLAQSDSGGSDRMFHVGESYRATAIPNWKVASEPNSRFPVIVRLVLQEKRYDGFNYVGSGTGYVFNPQEENISFRYVCDLTFAQRLPTEFQARWVRPGRKLEILLQKPGSTRTGTCRISTKPS